MAFTDAEAVPNILKNPEGFPERSGSGDIEYGSAGLKSLVGRLTALGVVLSVDTDGLAVDAPAGVLGDDLLDQMRAHRDELSALVRAVPGVFIDLGPYVVCPWCRRGDRLADDADGLRCDRCQRLAWRALPGGAIERVDYVEVVAVDVPIAVPSSTVVRNLSGGVRVANAAPALFPMEGV